MDCSCDIAANSLSHSSKTTAHKAKSRERSVPLLVLTIAPRVDVIDDKDSNETGSCWLLVSLMGITLLVPGLFGGFVEDVLVVVERPPENVQMF